MISVRHIGFVLFISFVASAASFDSVKELRETVAQLSQEISELKRSLRYGNDSDINDRLDRIEEKVTRNSEDISHNEVVLDRQVISLNTTHISKIILVKSIQSSDHFPGCWVNVSLEVRQSFCI